MKGFIEVTYAGDTKYTINVNQIVWFSASAGTGLKTGLILHDGTRFTVEESYEEVRTKIAEATK